MERHNLYNCIYDWIIDLLHDISFLLPLGHYLPRQLPIIAQLEAGLLAERDPPPMQLKKWSPK
jgi:hypothetical protein